MKQAGMRYYYGNSNQTNIPFVISKSTAPSHNIGVLNGLKIQQPLSGIPLTIAHHMGMFRPHPVLRHEECYRNNGQINVIKLGSRMLRLPSYKYMSYSRLLSLYREGEGMVPRSLATNCEDLDGATSKGRAGSQEAKQSLAEYANLFREYKQVNKSLKEGNYEPDLERRKEELTRELALREEHIRKVRLCFSTSASDWLVSLNRLASSR
ncbi:Uncharacterized protein OBRU01_03071, partial [Operophtera brumata]